MRCIPVLLLAFLLPPWAVISAPTPAKGSNNAGPKPWTPGPTPHIGNIVGVRPGAYEEGVSKKVDIHPGVVISGPHPETGKYQVAMISKKLPHDPPRAPINGFHHDTTMYGDVSLGPPVEVHAKDTKSWKNTAGHVEKPISPAGLEKLKEAMKPHAGWKPPTPPPSPTHPHPQPQHPPPPKPKPYSGWKPAGAEVHHGAGPSRSDRLSRPSHRQGPYPNTQQRQNRNQHQNGHQNQNHQHQNQNHQHQNQHQHQSGNHWQPPKHHDNGWPKRDPKGKGHEHHKRALGWERRTLREIYV